MFNRGTLEIVGTSLALRSIGGEPGVVYFSFGDDDFPVKVEIVFKEEGVQGTWCQDGLAPTIARSGTITEIEVGREPDYGGMAISGKWQVTSGPGVILAPGVIPVLIVLEGDAEAERF